MDHLKDEWMAHCWETRTEAWTDGSSVDLMESYLVLLKENRYGILSAKESVLVLSLA